MYVKEVPGVQGSVVSGPVDWWSLAVLGPRGLIQLRHPIMGSCNLSLGVWAWGLEERWGRQWRGPYLPLFMKTTQAAGLGLGSLSRGLLGPWAHTFLFLDKRNEGGWGRAPRILWSFKSRSSPLPPSHQPHKPLPLHPRPTHMLTLSCAPTLLSLAGIASRGAVTAQQLLVAAPTSRLRSPVKVSGALGVRVEPGRLGQQRAGSASRRHCGQGALGAGGAARAQTSALSGKLRRQPSVLARWAVALSSSPQGAPRCRVLCRPAFLPLRPGGGARGRRRHAVPAVESALRYVGTLEDS